MTLPIDILIEQLADKQTRNAARVELIKRGESAGEQLISKLKEDLQLDYRKTLLRILLEIKDARAEETFRQALHSEDEEIRAIAANGLFSLGTYDALPACLATINDAPDPLHYEITRSVLSLSEIGLSALPAVLPLLNATDTNTRQHAQKVFELVTSHEVSKSVSPRPLADTARTAWTSLWNSLGSYNWNLPEPERQRAMALWAQWLKNILKTGIK